MKMTVKQRKMMCMLPLLVIPFLTLAFWALGQRDEARRDYARVKELLGQ